MGNELLDPRVSARLSYLIPFFDMPRGKKIAFSIGMLPARFTLAILGSGGMTTFLFEELF